MPDSGCALKVKPSRLMGRVTWGGGGDGSEEKETNERDCKAAACGDGGAAR